jgi:hypothetical protein
MKITAHNLDVEATHAVEIAKNGLTVIKIQAACGETTHQHSITIGAVDGTRPTPPSVADLQRILDDGRQFAASEAAFKESVRVASTQIS